ncbi:hypothetical protein AYO38_08705 [bacterium SCGC AG-212-C10]|nr:hypothetical protein AYO38_08705 [bacterium SCGC AG-212-C10]
MKEFKDRVAVVTGGASGMGLAFAHRFADEGMKVVIADIEPEPLAMAEAGLKVKGATVMAHRLDVSDAAAVTALADSVFAAFGNVHVVCNNAGVAGPFGPMWESPLGDWHWVLGVNLMGVVHGIQAFVPRMLANGDEGHIVNTASMAGLTVGGVGAPYNATKFGVVALSEHLYKDLALRGAKVSCSVLCPGLVATNILESDRNRPQELSDTAVRGDDPLGKQAEAWLKAALVGGFPPEYIAGRVFEAIRDDRFYIIETQGELKDSIGRRMEDILEGRNPAVLQFPTTPPAAN